MHYQLDIDVKHKQFYNTPWIFIRKTKITMKKSFLKIVGLCLIAMILTGCIKININQREPSIEEILDNLELQIDPVKYNREGSYLITVHYDKGGFEKMDLSRAYVAYDYNSILDKIDAITDGNVEETPDLPTDAKEELDEAVGEGRLVKVAVITVETMDDQTLKVQFTDKDEPIIGKEYYFVIPNMSLSGSFIPEE